MSVTWRPVASTDVRRIITHIADENPIAARRVAQELFVAGASLAVFPHRGRRGRTQGTRELVAVQPYIIVYEIDRDAVTILRVWHAAQARGETY
ncbi:MAG TPA: type II toxin-antitoxin system RelE/ParE family toxin [Patescibacteria group bacterium]|nr:type II toxin-antitoxin system RelE/ParE family toxin [Patescibacteria group bacterium]